MKSFPCVIRIWALFLSLALALPNPAFALRVRNGGLEEQTPTTRAIANAIGYVSPILSTGGLEEIRGPQKLLKAGQAHTISDRIDRILAGGDPASNFLWPTEYNFLWRWRRSQNFHVLWVQTRDMFGSHFVALRKAIGQAEKRARLYRNGVRTLETLPRLARVILRYGVAQSRRDAAATPHPAVGEKELKLFAEKYWDSVSGSVPEENRERVRKSLERWRNYFKIRTLVDSSHRADEMEKDFAESFNAIEAVLKHPQYRTLQDELLEKQRNLKSQDVLELEQRETLRRLQERWRRSSLEAVEKLIQTAPLGEQQPIGPETPLHISDQVGEKQERIHEGDEDVTLGHLRARLSSEPAGIVVKRLKSNGLLFRILNKGIKLRKASPKALSEAIHWLARSVRTVDRFLENGTYAHLFPPTAGLEENIELFLLPPEFTLEQGVVVLGAGDNNSNAVEGTAFLNFAGHTSGLFPPAFIRYQRGLQALEANRYHEAAGHFSRAVGFFRRLHRIISGGDDIMRIEKVDVKVRRWALKKLKVVIDRAAAAKAFSIEKQRNSPTGLEERLLAEEIIHGKELARPLEQYDWKMAGLAAAASFWKQIRDYLPNFKARPEVPAEEWIKDEILPAILDYAVESSRDFWGGHTSSASVRLRAFLRDGSLWIQIQDNAQDHPPPPRKIFSLANEASHLGWKLEGKNLENRTGVVWSLQIPLHDRFAARMKEESWVLRLGSWGPISFEIQKLPERDRLSLQEQVDRFLLGRSVRLGEELDESYLSHTQRYGIPRLIATLRRQLDGNPESAVERISFALDWAGALKERLYPKEIHLVDPDDLFLELFQKGVPLASAAAPSDEGFRENLKGLGKFLMDLHARSPRDLWPDFAIVVKPILSYYDGFPSVQRPQTPQQFSDDLALFELLVSVKWNLEKIAPDEFVEVARQLGNFDRQQASEGTVRLQPSLDREIEVPLGSAAGLEEGARVPAVVDVYAHPSVGAGVLSIIPKGWQLGAVKGLSEDAAAANAGLEEAAQKAAQGRLVVVAVDAAFKVGLKLPSTAVVIVLDPATLNRVNRDAVVSYLEHPQRLWGFLMDLTSGSVGFEELPAPASSQSLRVAA